MMPVIALLALFNLFNVGFGQSDSCFVPGECLSGIHVECNEVATIEECLELCINREGCSWFTFYPSSNYCNLMEGCDNLSTEKCKDCLSGEASCKIQPVCFVPGRCEGNVIQTVEHVPERSDCLTSCKQTPNCTWFTHILTSEICILYDTCPVIDESCGETNGCTSGESWCEDEPDDSPWHMTIGGWNGAAVLSSVELYNWKTGQQCFIDPLPEAIYGHSSTLMNGEPIVCGGADNAGAKADCYHYQRDTKKWAKINDLMAPTIYASSIQIPGKGWYLFGGNELETSQKLVYISSNWVAGPAVPTPGIKGQCAVQINETVTAFIGGTQDIERYIFTYDWTSQNPTFVLENEELVRNRRYSTCGLIMGKDGLPVVAIIGGDYSDQRGMEIWNPRLKTVELLWDMIPPEEGGIVGLTASEMVVLKDGREILLYGGWQGSPQDGIWKYISADNTWERVGNLLEKRAFHVTLPVFGMECP